MKMLTVINHQPMTRSNVEKIKHQKIITNNIVDKVWFENNPYLNASEQVFWVYEIMCDEFKKKYNVY